MAECMKCGDDTEGEPLGLDGQPEPLCVSCGIAEALATSRARESVLIEALKDIASCHEGDVCFTCADIARTALAAHARTPSPPAARGEKP